MSTSGAWEVQGVNEGDIKMQLYEFMDYFKVINVLTFTGMTVKCFDCKKYIDSGQVAYIFFAEISGVYTFCCKDCYDKLKEEQNEFINIF